MIEATAPGKIILYGEHAVVYGRPAIAVPLADVQAQAAIRSSPAGAGFHISAPDLNRDYRLSEAGTDDPLAVIIWSTLRRLNQTSPPDVTLRVTSTIPLGRGLGSGAAISTSIARALAQFFQQPLAPAEISALVYEVEKLYHGTPSGIDNTVIAFEQPVYFIKGQPIQRLTLGQALTLVIGDTGVVAPTHTVVGDLRRRWQLEPERYEAYFDRIATLVDQARGALAADRPDLFEIGKLMDQNQRLLEALEVSSPQLARLVAAARQAGALGAKLSGAGWGGNMLALVEPERVDAVAKALRQAGAVQVIATEVRPGTL